MCDFFPHIVTIPITTIEEYNYLVHLEKINIKKLHPQIIDKIKVDIYDVNLKLVDAAITDINTNNFSTLYTIGSILLDFMIDNNVILYYYCDTKPINKGKKRIHISHQEFRHMLFETMYKCVTEKRKTSNIVDNAIVISDKEEKHYIHLLSTSTNLSTVEILKSEFEELNK